MAKEYTNKDYANDVKFVFTYSKLGPNITEQQKLDAMRMLTAVKPMLSLNMTELRKRGYLPMESIDRMFGSEDQTKFELRGEFLGHFPDTKKDLTQLYQETQAKIVKAINTLYLPRFNGAVTRIKKFAKPPLRPNLERTLEQASLFDNPVAKQTESDHLGPDGNKR